MPKAIIEFEGKKFQVEGTREQIEQAAAEITGQGKKGLGFKETLKQAVGTAREIASVPSEFVSGQLGGAPREVLRRPVATAVGGPGLAQMQAGANLIGQLMGQPEVSAKGEKGLRQLLPQAVSKAIPRELPQVLPEAQTETGKVLGGVAGLLGGLTGLPGQLALRSGVKAGVAVSGQGEKLAESFFKPEKVKSIQRAFRGFQRTASKDFVKSITEGTKQLKAAGKSPLISLKESEAIFSPILQAADDTSKLIPRAAKIATEQIDNLSINDLLRKKQQLKRSLSVAERTGKIRTDRSVLINNTVSNIDETIKAKIPGISEANQEYATFAEVRDLIQKFAPEKAGLPGLLGTQKGTKFLRNVFNLEPGEIEALRKFENAVDISIVEPAKAAALVRGVASAAEKIIPLVAGFAILGAIGATDARKALDILN